MSFKPLIAFAVAGLVLASGAQAWAETDCRPERGGWGRSPRSPVRVFVQYGRPSSRSRHRHGWSRWNDWDRRPVRHYTKVAAPVCPAPAQETMVVNVRNANGSYTPVTLRRQGGTYIGPRGEMYLSVPTEDQLRQVYGLDSD